MRASIWKAATLAAALGVMAASWGDRGPSIAAVPTTPCLVGSRPASVAEPTLAAGNGMWASVGDGVARVDASAGRVVVADDGAGVIRHVSTRPGVGTAYVRDRAGGDIVVAVTPSGVRRYPQSREAFHPAMSATGDLAWSVGTAIRVRSAAGSATSYPAPGALSLFSPVYADPGSLIVVGSAPPTIAVPEGDRRNDLWRLDLDTGIWMRLTSFHAGTDRWSVIRTPFLDPGGDLEFVRVTGRASSTDEPRFELWRYASGRASRLSVLEGERYLAGVQGDVRWWNVPSEGGTRMGIVREGPGGEERTVGCGAVSVDPSWLVDPDRAVSTNGPPKPVSERARAEFSEPSTGLAILVGDFASSDAAEQAAVRVRGATDAEVRVIGHPQAPLAIRPEAFAVVFGLTAEDDPQLVLDGLRARLPEFASMSWVVTL